MPPETRARKSLCNLLGYADEILQAVMRIVSGLAKDALPIVHEHDIAGLEARADSIAVYNRYSRSSDGQR